MTRRGPIVALETTPAAARTFAALAAGSPPDRFVRYRDLALYDAPDDPDDPILRDRRRRPVRDGLVAYLRASGARALWAAAVGPGLRRFLRGVKRALPALPIVLVGPPEVRPPRPSHTDGRRLAGLGVACAAHRPPQRRRATWAVAALLGDAAPAGALDAAEALVREADGREGGARRLLETACRARHCAGRPTYELVRMQVQRPDATLLDRLRALETRLPGLAIDPVWVAMEAARAAWAEGRIDDARRIAESTRAIFPAPPTHRPTATLGALLEALRARPAVVAAEGPAVVPPASGRTRADRPDVTFVALMRDDETGRAVAPAGVLALVAALRDVGRSAVVVDRQLAPSDRFADLDDLVAAVGDPGSVLGLSAMADRLPLLVRAAAALRAAFPDRLIVAGGPGPSSVAAALLEAAPALDAVVVGEGEETLVELLARHEAGGRAAIVGCPGVTARRPDDGVVVPGPPRPRLLDLDRLPLPAYDAVDLARYEDVPVVTARGCPYGCAFCDASALWGRRRTVRSLDHVLRELVLLRERYDRRHVHVEDDTFLLPRGRAEAFCLAVRERLPDLTWGCLGRADAVDETLLDTLVGAGCRTLFLGLESASDAVLERIAKGSSAAAGLRTALLAVHRLAVRAYFIWGFPFESYEAFEETFTAAALLRCEGVDVGHSLLAPFPTTSLWREYGATARLRPHVGLPRLFHPPPVDTEEGRLVADHPAAFPFFRTYETPEWERKAAFVARYRRADVRPTTPHP